MAMANDPPRCVLKKTHVAIPLLFLCTVPVFYGMVLRDSNSYLYVSAWALRFLLTAGIGCVMRGRYREALARRETQRKRVMRILVGCVCAGAWLHFDRTAARVYSTASSLFGIYDSDRTPLFLAVLWEQLFAGDLFWSVLLCLGVVFFPRLGIRRAAAQRD